MRLRHEEVIPLLDVQTLIDRGVPLRTIVHQDTLNTSIQ